jgi:uncharacterized membrane protein YkoI
MILAGTSDSTKAQFSTIENNVPTEFISEDEAKTSAFASCGLREDESISRLKVSASIGGGKMEYVVLFYHNSCRHEITVSATDGAILNTYVGKPSSLTLEQFFAQANGGSSGTSGTLTDFVIVPGTTVTITPGTTGDLPYAEYNPSAFGSPSYSFVAPGGFAQAGGQTAAAPSKSDKISESQAIRNCLQAFGIDKVDLRRTDVVAETKDGKTLYLVTLLVFPSDEYEFVVNAYGGDILAGTKNGEEMK